MSLIERLRDEPRLHEVSNGLNSVEMMVWHKTALEAADKLERLTAQIVRHERAIAAYKSDRDRLQAELKLANAVVDKAFLAGVDHHVMSRSRMDMPRDRIGLLRYWKAEAIAAAEQGESDE